MLLKKYNLFELKNFNKFRENILSHLAKIQNIRQTFDQMPYFKFYVGT